MTKVSGRTHRDDLRSTQVLDGNSALPGPSKGCQMDDVWDVYKPPGGSPKFLLACLNIAYLIACFHHFLLFFLLLCGLLSRLARSKCCLQSWAPTSAPHHGPHGSHGSAAPCRIDLTTVVGGCVPVASVTGDLCHLVKMKNQIHQILEKELMPLMYITANLL